MSEKSNHPGAKKEPRPRAALSIRDRFEKHRVFSLAGIRLIHEGGGRGAGRASEVWQILWSLENSKTGLVTIGRRKLSKHLGLNVGTIHYALKVLIDLGFVKVVLKGRHEKRAATYQLFGYPAGKSLPSDVVPRKVRSTCTAHGSTYCPDAKECTAGCKLVQGICKTNTPQRVGTPPLAGSSRGYPPFANPKAALAILVKLHESDPLDCTDDVLDIIATESGCDGPFWMDALEDTDGRDLATELIDCETKKLRQRGIEVLSAMGFIPTPSPEQPGGDSAPSMKPIND